MRTASISTICLLALLLDSSTTFGADDQISDGDLWGVEAFSLTEDSSALPADYYLPSTSSLDRQIAYSEDTQQSDSSVVIADGDLGDGLNVNIPDLSRIPDYMSVNDGKLHITVAASWISKYLVRGFDATDDSGMWAVLTHVELWDTGFFFQWVGAYPAHDRDKSLIPGSVPGPLQELVNQRIGSLEREINDTNVFNLFWGKQNWLESVDLKLGGGYLDFWRLDSEKADFWEVYGIMRFRGLPFKPHIEAHYGWPSDSDRSGEGWSTSLGIEHMYPLKDVSLCGIKPLGIKLTGDIWYNGGELYTRSETGWSFATFAAAMPIPIAENMMFIPAVYYQWSIEDTLNDDDEVYASLTLQYNW